MPVVIVKTGPMFDGRAKVQLQRACDDITRRVAILGASMVRSTQHTTFKQETPYYRLQNEARPDPPGWMVWDRNVIYGPWLEGVGSRNFPATRFRGYFIYRRTTQILDRRAGVMADYIMHEWMGGMN